jgi:hypothetical protein
MSKRRVAGESDGESTSKRARTEEASEFEDAPNKPAKQARKSRAQDADDDLNEGDYSGDEDDTEGQEAILKTYLERRKQKGVSVFRLLSISAYLRTCDLGSFRVLLSMGLSRRLSSRSLCVISF